MIVLPAKTQINLGIHPVWSELHCLPEESGCPGWSECSLGAQPFCLFCHEVLFLNCHHLCLTKCLMCPSEKNNWHDKTNKICAPSKRLGSVWASAQSDQSLLCAQWVPEEPRYLHADSEDTDQTDLSLHWANRSFCRFFYAAAQLTYHFTLWFQGGCFSCLRKQTLNDLRNLSHKLLLESMTLQSKRIYKTVKISQTFLISMKHIGGNSYIFRVFGMICCIQQLLSDCFYYHTALEKLLGSRAVIASDFQSWPQISNHGVMISTPAGGKILSKPKQEFIALPPFIVLMYSSANRSYRRRHLMNTLLGPVHFYSR